MLLIEPLKPGTFRPVAGSIRAMLVEVVSLTWLNLPPMSRLVPTIAIE